MAACFCLTLVLMFSVSETLTVKVDIKVYTFKNIVQTTFGCVQGSTKQVQTTNGQSVEVDEFLGVPFAKPPVGDLRFRPPVPVDPWDGVYLATTPPNSCVQVLQPFEVLLSNPPTPQSEDCLYLNIWRPRCHLTTGMATIFWIHSGDFVSGSSTIDSFDGAILAASECVIVASTNYRVGALGFLYVAVPEAPGNAGLFDVALALKFIKNNVNYFGGDDRHITLAGLDAGGSIASMFLFSPLTKNLFRNMITQDGPPFSRYAWESKELALEAAFAFSERLNCSSNNKTAIVECLKQINASSLVVQHVLDSAIVAVPDGHFLTQEAFEALASRAFKRTNVLIGTNKNVGILIALFLWPDEYNFNQQPGSLTERELEQKLTQVFSSLIKEEFVAQVLADVKNVYQLNHLGDEALEERFQLLAQILSDAATLCPSRLLATAYANESQNVYLYSFNHGPDITIWPTWLGPTHTAEIPYVFGNPTAGIPGLSPRELPLRQKVMRYWANFAKYNNPSPFGSDVPFWPTYNPPDPANILLFTDSTDIQVGLTDTRGCAYWNSLPPEYYII